MGPTRARRRIRELARADRWEFTSHALGSLTVRDASVEDVFVVLTTATACHGEQGGRWRLSGPDRLDDPLTLIVELQAQVIVVTLFRGDE
ncbi:MAG: hypothetical protein NVSMB23_19120 [Myxococcales bacterium]